MMLRTAQLLEAVEKAYREYKFYQVYRVAYDFVNELSAVYMDAAKDRLYSEAPGSVRRRAVQTVLLNILEVLVRVLAPVLSFTCDEVWELYPPAMRAVPGRPESVQLAGWPRRGDFAPALPDAEATAAVLAGFAPVLAVRDVVTKALEEARNAKLIGKSQEAAVTVLAPPEELEALRRFEPAVYEDLLIVAEVRFAEGPELAAEVAVAPGEKCPRCWTVRALGGNPRHPEVCERCGDALDAIGA